MKTPGIVAIALVSAAIGATAGGWVVGSPRMLGRSPSPNGAPPLVALGDVAGVAGPSPALAMLNPQGRDPGAVARGRRLFVQMNCAGCHGYDGGGGMGPSLTDSYWRYGGAPLQIYRTLYDGRPQGMPAWGHALPSSDLWALTAYVQSLGGTSPPAGTPPPATRGKTNPNPGDAGNAIEGQ